MKKLLLLVAFLCSIASAAYAQHDTTSLMSMGLDFGKAIGQTTRLYNTAAGISFKFEFPFHNSNANLVAGVAYASYSTQNTPLADTMQNGHFVPLFIGLKYYVYHSIYVEGDAGESFNINSGYMGYQTAFYYSAGAGYSLPISHNTAAIDFSLRYESRPEDDININQVALRVAYKFKL
jgi:opacity protein-like surface antigen